MESPSSTQPNFLMVFCPEISATKLKIPARVTVALPKNVTLRDKYNNNWQVKARKVDGHWYFMDGWAKFVEDNSVARFDMLVFDYSCPGLFDVKILGSDGDVKEGVGYCMFDTTHEFEDETEDDDTWEVMPSDNNASGSRKPHQKKRNIDCLSKGILKTGLPSKTTKSSYSVRRMKPSLINELNREESIWNNVSEEEDTEDESLELIRPHDKKGKGRAAKEPRADMGAYTASGSGNPHQKRRNVDHRCGKKFITSGSAPRPKNPYSPAKMPPLRINEPDNRGKGILSESSDEDSDYLGYGVGSLEEEFRSRRVVNKGAENAQKLKSKVGDAKATPSKKPHRNRVNVDWLGRKFFESGLAPRPQCTYFVTTMKPKRMNELYIPKDLLMDENLYLPKKMKLVDPSGDTYIARLVSWTDGRTFYKGGWSSLCRRNKLRKEDFCICEFGEGDESGYLFISFIRAILRH